MGPGLAVPGHGLNASGSDRASFRRFRALREAMDHGQNDAMAIFWSFCANGFVISGRRSWLLFVEREGIDDAVRRL
jgi:hypothetical protein